MDGIHVHTDLLPFLIIADCIVTDTFGARSRHLILAGTSVTHRTDLAVRAHISSCCIHYFFKIHLYVLLFFQIFLHPSSPLTDPG